MFGENISSIFIRSILKVRFISYSLSFYVAFFYIFGILFRFFRPTTFKDELTQRLNITSANLGNFIIFTKETIYYFVPSKARKNAFFLRYVLLDKAFFLKSSGVLLIHLIKKTQMIQRKQRTSVVVAFCYILLNYIIKVVVLNETRICASLQN